MTTQDHREAFEKWYSLDFYLGMCEWPEWSKQKNTYTDFEAHVAWYAFQQGMRYRDELDAPCVHDWREGYGIPTYCRHCGTFRDELEKGYD